MYIILVFFFIVALWLFSIYLLSYWKYVYWYAFFNLLLIVVYYSIIVYGGKYIWGHDEYGLGTFFKLILGLIIHVLIGFIFALYKSFALRNAKRFD